MIAPRRLEWPSVPVSAFTAPPSGILGPLGFRLRRFLTVGRGFPDFPIALAEDVITVGLCMLALSRLSA